MPMLTMLSGGFALGTSPQAGTGTGKRSNLLVLGVSLVPLILFMAGAL